MAATRQFKKIKFKDRKERMETKEEEGRGNRKSIDSASRTTDS